MNTRRNCLLPDDVEPSTPARDARAAGLNSLTQVMMITGVSLQTLSNWYKHKPELFRIVLLGCVEYLDIRTLKGR